MSTKDVSNYQEAIEKLESIVEFSSFFTNSHPKPIYDKVLLNDPFDKSTLMKRAPTSCQDHLNDLINTFEESLKRVLDEQILPPETVIGQYITRLNRVIELASQYESITGADPERYGYSITPYSVRTASVKVTLGKRSPTSSDLEDNGSQSKLRSKKRTPISKEAKQLLETIFETKRTPNGKERKIIAEKCGLTPLQVRVWFTNKRMRSK